MLLCSHPVVVATKIHACFSMDNLRALPRTIFLYLLIVFFKKDSSCCFSSLLIYLFLFTSSTSPTSLFLPSPLRLHVLSCKMFGTLALVSTALASFAAAAPISTESHTTEVFGNFSEFMHAYFLRYILLCDVYCSILICVNCLSCFVLV